MKPQNQTPLTYEMAGVNYALMDPFKRLAQAAGQETAQNILRFGVHEVEWSRGESTYLIETPQNYLAHVEESLGTKNLVADAMYELTGKTYYDSIAQDTVAMIVNDMITLGALPLSVEMHLAVGDSAWFDDEKRAGDLIRGWAEACKKARCAWGGGETPTLKGIVNPKTAVLSGSALGIISPKERLIKSNIQEGDVIVILRSSGIHSNGLTLARRIAEALPDGYLTMLTDGKTYGESLLEPTIIYVPVIDDALAVGIEIHYAVNITGHGLRKLMRSVEPFYYVIDSVFEPHPVFDFIQKNGPVDDEEAYGTLNMGQGFAVILDAKDVPKMIEVSQKHKIPALQAGIVERHPSGDKAVIIQPKGLEYKGETLGVR